jgi:phage terminase small subunit
MEYIIDFNGTRAYKKIYPKSSDESARREASRLLTKVDIQKYIANLIKPKCDELNITVESVLRDIVEIKERCMQKIPVYEYDKSSREKVETGEWEFDSTGALKATDQLGKYLKMFTDKVEMTGKDGEPMENKIIIEFVKPKK